MTVLIRTCAAILLLAFCIASTTATGANETPSKWWVFFADNGSSSSPEFEGRVSAEYIDAVHEIAPISVVTQWFNGVSVFADESARDRIRALPFVREMRPVGTYIRPDEPPSDVSDTPLPRPTRATTLDYGGSQGQVTQLNAHLLHDIGITGDGVLIGFLDSGFSFIDDHPAFHHPDHPLDIVYRYDFAENDTDVTDSQTSADHGTQVLSCAVSYAPGSLIGTAYGASVALGRTEIASIESRIEEDYWVRGLEYFVDTLGVDIVSSSLGYNWFDAALGPNHDWSEADGNTAMITNAADKAAGKGVTVVVAAGNERCYSQSLALWNGGKILLPGDGDSVITVGGVSSTGTSYSCSSLGPTADGRIKPDISARAVAVTTVTATSGKNGTSYGYATPNGTSFATPLIAGVAALLLEAHPDWDPHAIRTAMRLSGTQATSPDTVFGWGIVDAWKAYCADSAIYGRAVDPLSGKPPVYNAYVRLFDGADEQVGSAYVSNTDGWFLFDNLEPGNYTLRGYVDGTTMVREVDVTIPMTPAEFRLLLGDPNAVHNVGAHPERFVVGNPFPNPANPTVSIEYNIANVRPSEWVQLSILNTLGQTIRTERYQASPSGVITWDGRDMRGRPVSTGVYIARLRLADAYDQPGMIAVRRITLLR